MAGTRSKQNCDAAVLKHDHREGEQSVQRRIKQTKVALLQGADAVPTIFQSGWSIVGNASPLERGPRYQSSGS